MLLNPRKTKDELVAWIRGYFQSGGPALSAVLGISGGKDSSICAALLKEALGSERVVGVMMPCGTQSDIDDARLLVSHLGIAAVELNIGPACRAMTGMLMGNEALAALCGTDACSGADAPRLPGEAGVNLPPRLRMAALYAMGQLLPGGARVVNTCNASEDYVGYSTKYGDAAGDVSLLSHLLVEEVLQIGDTLDLPPSLVRKTPSDGLSGQTDEEKLGFTYKVLDRYILTGICEDEAVKARIDRLHGANLHKLRPMPAFALPKEARA